MRGRTQEKSESGNLIAARRARGTTEALLVADLVRCALVRLKKGRAEACGNPVCEAVERVSMPELGAVRCRRARVEPASLPKSADCWFRLVSDGTAHDSIDPRHVRRPRVRRLCLARYGRFLFEGAHLD